MMPADAVTYYVQEGDTLSGIALRFLGDAGRFPEIWERNKGHLRGSCASWIYPGEKIVIEGAVTAN